MKHRQANNGVIAGNGINGSLRKRETTQPQQHTEYYLFNSQGNLKAYSDDVMSFAYYGYNAANTRAYKLSLYNTNLWINGQQQPLNMQLQNAMFYPNTYLNFNGNGEYTKHYYNGTERIASRLGDNTTTIALNNNILEARKLQLEEQFREDIHKLIEETVPIDLPPFIDVNALQPTGTPNDIYYYHPNHLGSTSFVTDQNQTISQGFLYAPFGEITTEYNINFGNNTIPKYAFNAKELDEETGFYYYEARYYKPPVFTSRDPMFEKYFWMTPYAYCANNPVKYVDPTGKWPTKQISGGKVTRQFSNTKKTHPITGTKSRHLGVDFAVPTGTKVYSAAAGTVISTGYQYNTKRKTGYGYYVDIQHENGYVTKYAHLSKIEVKVNDVIADGTQIGLSGASGGVTGPHLHFEIMKNGEKIDPLTINDLQTQINFENFTPILLKEVIVTDIAPDFELINPQIDMNKKYLEKALKQIIDDFKQNLNTNEK